MTIDHNSPEREALLPKKPTRRPLPKQQLAIICLCRLAEPIAFTQIFPYVNQMVEELHVTDKPTDIGFYSGLIDGLFNFAQLLTIIHWSRLSDRIGRKPVICFGLTGVALGSACFGMSSSFWQMLLFRAMAGGLTANIACIKSMVTELTDETNQASAFPLIQVVWSIGGIVGPLIGGSLSHPVERYPALFGSSELLRRHPFALPCFVSSLLTIFSLVLAILFLEETLPSKVATQNCIIPEAPIDADASGSSNASTAEALPETPSDAQSIDSSPPAIVTLLANPRVRQVLLAESVVCFLYIAATVVFALFAYTPARFGGLQLSPTEIGISFAVGGMLGLLCTAAYPIFHRRLGTIPITQACMWLYPILFVLFAATSLLARATLGRENETGSPSGVGPIWTAVLAIQLIIRVAIMADTGLNIALKDAAPNRQSLGALFALLEIAVNVAESVAPAFVSSLFALSIDRQILGGQFVWMVMFGVGIAGVVMVRRL